MHQQIFVNVAVDDLPRSKAFFEHLGYQFNSRYCNDDGASLILGDNLYVMLLTKPFFKTFSHKKMIDSHHANETLICLSCDSREQVNALVAKAKEAGATVPVSPQDHGFMYVHGFHDLDGHIWELCYMESDNGAEI
ncbi:VOC family protein [Neptunicella sp. SCSIO 80796]|uniref:VOC family protein n=1 Tax=Neptunicella plasticusilytica TaxID=3117012 RepID=UPI003A4D5291